MSKPFDHAFTLKDNANVQETFADGVEALALYNSMFRLILTVSRPDPPKTGSKSVSGHKSVAARIVMPPAAISTISSIS